MHCAQLRLLYRKFLRSGGMFLHHPLWLDWKECVPGRLPWPCLRARPPPEPWRRGMPSVRRPRGQHASSQSSGGRGKGTDGGWRGNWGKINLGLNNWTKLILNHFQKNVNGDVNESVKCIIFYSILLGNGFSNTSWEFLYCSLPLRVLVIITNRRHLCVTYEQTICKEK